MKYLLLLLCLTGVNHVNAQQFLNGSFEPTGTLTSCTQVPNSSFNTQMGYAWINSGTNQAYLGDNTCGTAAAGTHYIGAEYDAMLGGTNIVLKLSSPMIAGNTYKFSFSYKASATEGAATIFFGYNNNADTLGHDSTITFLLPPTSTTSWTTVTDSIKPLVNSQFVFFRAGTLGGSPLITYIDNFVMQCNAAPVANFTHTGTHTVNFTYTGTGSPDSVKWNFGDGGTSTTVSPVHTFTASGTYSVCVTAYSACGNNTSCQNTVATVVGVNNVFNSYLEIYPNPVSAELVIAMAPAGTIVKISDMLSREMYTGIISSDKEVINTSNYPGGIYIIQLIDKEGNRDVRKIEKE